MSVKNIKIIQSFINEHSAVSLEQALNAIKNLNEEELVTPNTWDNTNDQDSLLHYLLRPEFGLSDNAKNNRLGLVRGVLANPYAQSAIKVIHYLGESKKRPSQDLVKENGETSILKAINLNEPAIIWLMLTNPKIIAQTDLINDTITLEQLKAFFNANLIKASLDENKNNNKVKVNLATVQLSDIDNFIKMLSEHNSEVAIETLLPFSISQGFYSIAGLLLNREHDFNLAPTEIKLPQAGGKVARILDSNNAITAVIVNIQNNKNNPKQLLTSIYLLQALLLNPKVDLGLNIVVSLEEKDAKVDLGLNTVVSLEEKDAKVDLWRKIVVSLKEKDALASTIEEYIISTLEEVLTWNIKPEAKLSSFKLWLPLYQNHVQTPEEQPTLLVIKHLTQLANDIVATLDMDRLSKQNLIMLQTLYNLVGSICPRQKLSELIDTDYYQNHPQLSPAEKEQRQQDLTANKIKLEEVHLKWIDLDGKSEQDFIDQCNQLISQGADVNALSTSYEPFLILAIKHNTMEIATALLQKEGINVNAQDNGGNTALMLAISKDKEELATKLLLKDDINVNTQNSRGYTALMLAITKDKTEIVTKLLQKEGINVNTQNNDGYTALMLAILKDKTEIVTKLLQKENINTNITNCFGQTAMYIAKQQGYTSIVKLIEDKAQEAEGTFVARLAAQNKSHIPNF
ncbi:ankyrin repeat domain-containing protein [Rickettsiales endosymbiont of Stachyamoeba lipophora]|uniref:ankyrin repeat domain-containing protein n=1 Tax=Rickettsiales endosymbiont of Stachyamoeba lipophora TaxID=2486578 RepID=UPI000F6493F8|nr:ankyrin repeat domain-containing protein [Rickettsiales endosymbiont of Stachyamoeba lipophora]AZL16151.1 ankyrin repeat domain-containing protein [Rickettsiales endosymbiont of Stachyamoeba lipophora]